MFIPSQNGFKFVNAFETYPVVTLWGLLTGKYKLFHQSKEKLLKLKKEPKRRLGNTAAGLCGAMSFTMLDYYYSNTPIPQQLEAPKHDDPLFQYLCQRQLDSIDFPFGWWRTAYWSMLSGSLYQRTFDQFMTLRLPTPIILIKVHSFSPRKWFDNHVVIFYERRNMKAMICDPNYPEDDELHLDLNDGKIVHSQDGEIRGFAGLNYRYQIPV